MFWLIREKCNLQGVIENVSAFSGVEVKTYYLMDNQFHLIVKVSERQKADKIIFRFIPI